MCDSLGQSDQKIEIWKLTMLGKTVCFNNFEAVLDTIELEIEDFSEDKKVEVEIKMVKMHEHELKKLPEFVGY